jgi:hypothetical protein
MRCAARWRHRLAACSPPVAQHPRELTPPLLISSAAVPASGWPAVAAAAELRAALATTVQATVPRIASPIEPPTCRSAAAMASTRERVRAGSALANESRRWNACQAAPVGLAVPKSAIAWRASSRNCSPVMSCGDTPVIWYRSGISPAVAS